MSDDIILKDKAGNPGALMRQATDVAGVCSAIVKSTAQNIGGRKYVRVEGWQSIATAFGCVASARDVEVVEGGVRAVGEVRRMNDGAVIATAEGFVGEDEPTWYGGKGPYGKDLPKRPMYAIRAMAQTRAVSRACRSAFAFVVTMIDSSLSTTPAEEVPVEGFADAAPVQAMERTASLKAQLVAAAPKPSPRPAVVDSVVVRPAVVPAPVDNGMTLPNYGKHKGEPMATADADTLRFYISGSKKTLADPAKAKFHPKEQKVLAALESALAMAEGRYEPPQPDGDEPPPHTDSDAPF
jgi:hypothetical protein